MVGGAYLATRWPGNVMKKKLVTYVDAELLSAVRALAKTEGRQIQAVVQTRCETT